MKYSLLSLLLLLTIAGLGVCLWVERSKQPEAYFLHVYSHRYRPHQDGAHHRHDAPRPNWINTRIGSVSAVSGVPFYYNAPLDRDPELILEGTIEKSGNSINCNFSVSIDDIGTTFVYRHNKPVNIDNLVPFWNDYYFAISKNSDPYELEYDLEQ